MRNSIAFFKLNVVQLGKDSAFSHQFFVSALFLDPVGSDHKDAVCILNGGQAVGHNQCGSIFGQLGEGVLDQFLRFRIEGRGGLIQIKMGGFFKNMRAMAIRCFCPPESFSPRSPIWVS